MKDFVVIQCILHKEGKSVLSYDTLEKLARKFLNGDEYESLFVNT